jgi:hypothetical protein
MATPVVVLAEVTQHLDIYTFKDIDSLGDDGKWLPLDTLLHGHCINWTLSSGMLLTRVQQQSCCTCYLDGTCGAGAIQRSLIDWCAVALSPAAGEADIIDRSAPERDRLLSNAILSWLVAHAGLQPSVHHLMHTLQFCVHCLLGLLPSHVWFPCCPVQHRYRHRCRDVCTSLCCAGRAS